MPRPLLTLLAEDGLREIYRFIARENHSPAAAARLLDSIRDKAELFRSCSVRK